MYNKCTIEERRLITLALETFKILNYVNQAFTKTFLEKEKYKREGKTT